jgi:hypothetical protein
MDRIRTQLQGWSRAGRTLVHEADTKALLTEVGISVRAVIRPLDRVP